MPVQFLSPLLSCPHSCPVPVPIPVPVLIPVPVPIPVLSLSPPKPPPALPGDTRPCGDTGPCLGTLSCPSACPGAVRALGKLRQGGPAVPGPAPAPRVTAALALGVALGVALAAVPELRVLPELRVPAETGTVFVHELEREPFLEALGGSEDDDAPVTFRAHLWDRPDLPRWLRFIQRDPGQPGYLYGSPESPELGTHRVQVLAYHRHTFATASQRVLISVTPAPGGDAPFRAEFLVGDRNVEELLPEGMRDQFLRGAAGLWGRGDLRVTNVTSALHRGHRVPLPIEGRREGVYVQVGSHSPFSPCLASAVSPQSRSRCHRGQRPLASCHDTFAPDFSIRWCNLTLLQLQPSPSPPVPELGSGVLPGGGDFDPPSAAPAPELLPGFLLTLLLPLAVAALLCLLLGHLMCCRREGLEKRNLATSELQLAHHRSILGDSRELRSMSRSRDVPRPLSTLPMFNVRTGQRCDPLGNLRDPLGNLRDPLGNLRDPLGNQRDGARAPLLPQ